MGGGITCKLGYECFNGASTRTKARIHPRLFLARCRSVHEGRASAFHVTTVDLFKLVHLGTHPPPLPCPMFKLASLDDLAIYRSGTVNSKSFVGKVLLRIKWKFELTYAL